MRKSCPIKAVDPDTCVDFSTNGTLVTDKFRDGWDNIFGKAVIKNFEMKTYGKAVSFDTEEELYDSIVKVDGQSNKTR